MPLHREDSNCARCRSALTKCPGSAVEFTSLPRLALPPAAGKRARGNAGPHDPAHGQAPGTKASASSTRAAADVKDALTECFRYLLAQTVTHFSSGPVRDLERKPVTHSEKQRSTRPLNIRSVSFSCISSSRSNTSETMQEAAQAHVVRPRPHERTRSADQRAIEPVLCSGDAFSIFCINDCMVEKAGARDTRSSSLSLSTGRAPSSREHTARGGHARHASQAHSGQSSWLRGGHDPLVNIVHAAVTYIPAESHGTAAHVQGQAKAA